MPRRHPPRGFSLLEVMVAGALFLVTVTGVLSATSTATATFEHQRKLTQAMSVAEYTIEELLLRYGSHDELRLNSARSGGLVSSATPATRCLGPDLLPATGCEVATIVPATGFASGFSGTAGLDGAYGINVVVTNIDDLSLRHLIVVVAWRESSGLRTLTLETYRP